MQTQHQIPVRPRRGQMKGLQTVFPRGGKRSKEHVAHAQLIPRVLEGYNVYEHCEKCSWRICLRETCLGTSRGLSRFDDENVW